MFSNEIKYPVKKYDSIYRIFNSNEKLIAIQAFLGVIIKRTDVVVRIKNLDQQFVSKFKLCKFVSFKEICIQIPIAIQRDFWTGRLYYGDLDDKPIDCIILEDNSIIILEKDFEFLNSRFNELFVPDYSDLVLQNFKPE